LCWLTSERAQQRGVISSKEGLNWRQIVTNANAEPIKRPLTKDSSYRLAALIGTRSIRSRKTVGRVDLLSREGGKKTLVFKF
jgi:hypothetical protein